MACAGCLQDRSIDEEAAACVGSVHAHADNNGCRLAH